MVFSVSGKVGGAKLENVFIAVPVKPGETIELTKQFYIGGMPRIFVTVLEVPTEDTAVLAIGPKEEKATS
jgi:hypothetical protein